MEIFLNLWDELDDLVGACRHVATATALEAASLVKPVARGVTTAALTVVTVSQSSWASLRNLF